MPTDYPFAVTTFTIKRPGGTTVVGYNHVPAGVTTVATGVAIPLRDLNGVLDVERGYNMQQGMYRGTCRRGTNVQAGDLLIDENFTENTGAPITYQVQDTTIYPFHIKLHLQRTVVGA